MDITAYQLALRFLNLAESAGQMHNPMILAMLQQIDKSVNNDETPWCSAFVAHIAWLLGISSSHSLSARSWLIVGRGIDLADAKPGWDVVVLKRGEGTQPGPNMLFAPGHVGFYSLHNSRFINLLGGNQGNKVSIASFPIDRVLGVRRLWGV